MGRHGGINILHQKSWHVWRLDNRLTVERDELRHAAEECEKERARHQAVFDAKLAQLRQRALSEEQHIVASSSSNADGGGRRLAPRSSDSAEGKNGKGKPVRQESTYKYGMVTTSNLKEAEKDLELSLKGQKQPQRYWGSGGLGTGPHINLFEEVELESRQHLAEHKKQLHYTERNNELVLKSKKALFSEFDEISRDMPWYLRRRGSMGPVAVGTELGPAAVPGFEGGAVLGAVGGAWQGVPESSCKSGSKSGLKQKARWTERHGQAVVCMRPCQRHEPKAAEDSALLDVVNSSSGEDENRKANKRKRVKKERRERKRAKEDKELAALRAERERREREAAQPLRRSAQQPKRGTCSGRAGCGLQLLNSAGR